MPEKTYSKNTSQTRLRASLVRKSFKMGIQKGTKMPPESKPGPPWETLGLPLEAKAAPGTPKTSKSEAQDLKMTSWKV